MFLFISKLQRSRTPSLQLNCYKISHNICSYRIRAVPFNRASVAFQSSNMAPKRKRSTAEAPTQAAPTTQQTPILPPDSAIKPPLNRRASKRTKIDTNPDHNGDIVDGKTALRASPDVDEEGESLDMKKLAATPVTPAKAGGVKIENGTANGDSLDVPASAKKGKKTPTKSSVSAKKGSDEIKAFKAEQAAQKAAAPKVKKEEVLDEWDSRLDPDGDDVPAAEDVDVVKLEGSRPPPVNSDYLPLPWKGRLGYVSRLYFKTKLR